MFLCAPNLSGDGAAYDKVRLSEAFKEALASFAIASHLCA